MKAITLWQPWASLLACGAKKFETRSWATNYRGPIALHAAQKPFNTDIYLDRELHIFAEALCLPDIYSFESLPYGCVIATAEMVECWKITDRGHTLGSQHAARIEGGKYGGKTNIVEGKEILFGDWTPGRYAWEFKNMMLLPKPIPAKGKQGLWNWDMVTVKKHGAMGRSELSALDFTSDEDMCAICGSYVLEGCMVCPACEADPFHGLKERRNKGAYNKDGE